MADVEALEEPLLKSTKVDTSTQPVARGVGRLLGPSGVCTASLISSRVILTAAHCFDFDTKKSGFGGIRVDLSDLNTGFTFKVDSSTFDVVKYAVLGSDYGVSDIAIARLKTDVPSSVAAPLTIASSMPANGATVIPYGYGCDAGHFDDRLDASDTTKKRKAGWVTTRTVACKFNAGAPYTCSNANEVCALFPDQNLKPGGDCMLRALPKDYRQYRPAMSWNTATNSTTLNVTCGGDSGGPIIKNQSDAIFALHSAGSGDLPGSSPDITANVVKYRSSISRLNAIYGNGVVCETCAKVRYKTSNGVNWLRAPGGGGSNVNAKAYVNDAERTFRLVPLTAYLGVPINGLQTDKGFWVTAESSGGSTVVANRKLLGSWEHFAMFSGSNDTRTMMADNGQYVVAEGGGGGDVNANRVDAGPWETFTQVVVTSAVP